MKKRELAFETAKGLFLGLFLPVVAMMLIITLPFTAAGLI
jgi:hypothetical protein